MWFVNVLPGVCVIFILFNLEKYCISEKIKPTPVSYSIEDEKPLVLTTLIETGKAELARQLSRVDSVHFLGIPSHSGFLNVKKEFNSNLFFWFFPIGQGRSLSDTPWIIWLQGGPGYSSLKGLFDLIGPFEIEQKEVKLRNVTWSSSYSVLFLDNPVGAGFSFTESDDGYPDNEDEVGAQMLHFLEQFLLMFPELRQAPLFIAGQSYAGKYVPALAIQIHRQNQIMKIINLKGLIIGNGLIDPRTMMHYSELCGALGVLEGKELEELKVLEQRVVKLIDTKKMVEASNAFNRTIEHIKKHSGVNIYNFQKDPIFATTEFELFLKRSDVKNAIHVGNLDFILNNQLVYEKMLPDIMNTTKPWLEELLEHYGVLGHSGQLDLIVPYKMSKYTYESLNWSKSKEYKRARRKPMYLPNSSHIVGYVKKGGNFVEALIRRAGHNPQVEEPLVVKYLVDNFIKEFSEIKHDL